MPDITYDVGRVSFVMKGAWNLATNYEKLDAVSYNGNLYIAKQDVPGGTAITNTTYWQLAAEKGDKGDTGGVDSVNGKQGDVWFPDSRQLISDSYTTDTEPFLMKGNDSDSDRFELTKRGNTVGLNQLMQNPTFEDTSHWGTVRGTLTVADHIGTFKSSDASDPYVQQSFSSVAGHKYRYEVEVRRKSGSGTVTLYAFYNGTANVQLAQTTSTSWTTLTAVVDNTTAGTNILRIGILNGAAGDEFEMRAGTVRSYSIWYGSNDRIPADLLAHPENWGDYYAGPLDHEPGRLESADGTVLTSLGTDGVTVLTEVDTGGEMLRSALDIADEKAPTGIITRKVGAPVTLNLSTMTFVQESGGGMAQWYSTDQPFASYKKPATNWDRANAQSGRFATLAYTDLASNSGFGITSTGRLGISNDVYTNRAAYTSVEFFCEAATPTTEQGTPFAPIVATVKNGVLSWTNTKGIPVGQESHWFQNLRKRVEDRLPDPPSADGTYRLTCTISGGVKTYSWEA